MYSIGHRSEEKIHFLKMASAKMIRCRQWFFQINGFEDGSTDSNIIFIQRCSSWFYLITFVTVISILLFYTARGSQTTTVKVEHPSLSTFEYLLKVYPTTLQCPCSNIHVQYSTFVQVYFRFHQVSIRF